VESGCERSRKLKREQQILSKKDKERGVAWKRAIFQRLEEGERQRKKERDLEKERRNGREEAQGRAKERYRQIETKRRRQRGYRRTFYSSFLFPQAFPPFTPRLSLLIFLSGSIYVYINTYYTYILGYV